MTWPPRPRTCLGDRVGEYVERSLPPDELLAWDRHLVSCVTCLGAADLERRLRATLRSAPEVPADLRTLLLSVSQEIPVAVPAPRPAGIPHRRPATVGANPPEPDARATRPGPDLGLVVLAQGAPAQHRSALRAALFATAAAGASAAAAWGMSVGPGASTARITPVPLPVRPASERQVTSFGTDSSLLIIQPASSRAGNRAQSSP